MNAPKSFYFLALVFSVVFYACTGSTPKEGSDAFKAKDLHGNWQVTEAIRNGSPTETLDGLFFRFSEEGQLSTNLLGSEQESSYELEGKTIYQKGEPSLKYTIEELAQNRLVISTTLQNMDFKMTLEKGE